MSGLKKRADLQIRRDVVGKPHPHDSADRHTQGSAIYIDDMPDVPGTLHIAPVLSPVAHGELKAINAKAANKMPGVVRVLTVADVPGHNDIAPIFSDEPVVVGPEPSDMSKINFMCFGCLSPLEEGASVRCLKCNLPLCSEVTTRCHALKVKMYIIFHF